MVLIRTLSMMLLVIILIAQPLDAASAKKNTKQKSTYNPRYAMLVMNADTREILDQKNAYSRRYPASLTKMMTLYMTFEALTQKRIKLSDTMVVSAYAAQQPKTNISLRRGDRLTVDQAIRALVVHSANDASVVLAEYLGGSEQRFATMMTQRAHQLGMNNTQFRNPHGLPNNKQYTTAWDMAVLGLALRKHFPQYFPYFKINKFTYHGREYKGHNRVMQKFAYADGIKTGYINASGFNLVSSSEKNGTRVIAVLMGEPTSKIRDENMVKLLEKAHARLSPSGSKPQSLKLYTKPN